MNNLSQQDKPSSRNWRQFVTYIIDEVFFWIFRERKDLVRILQRASDKGMLDSDSLAMIEGVFHVSDRQVRDIMIPHSQMKVLKKDMDFNTIQATVVESAHSRFPVIDDDPDVVEGVLLAKDLLRYVGDKDRENFRVRDILRQPYVVPESKRLKVLLGEFRRTRNHMAIVVDEYGSVAGLVTIEDVLEQIVGDITDEHDVAEDQYIYDYGNNNYLVKALTPLGDFNRYFDCHLSNDNSVDTVGGLIINAFGHLPKRGDTTKIENFTFEVSRADTRRVHLLRVKK